MLGKQSSVVAKFHPEFNSSPQLTEDAMKAARLSFLLIALGAIVYFVLFPGASSSQAQSTNPVSSPSAVALASKAVQALAGYTPHSDITLQANVNLILGSDEETGTAPHIAVGSAGPAIRTCGLSEGRFRRCDPASISREWLLD
jgi:hypothetical protein